MHKTLHRILIAALALAGLAGGAGGAGGAFADDVKLDAARLAPGSRIDLTSQWLYKPGYATAEGETPEKSDAPADGYVSIPVPQILNQIHWWLDDSEDFKKDEAQRLKKLGFDTEKAEDGWYRKTIELPEAGLPDGTRVFIQFDGVAMRSDTYINGHKLGHHDGMFSRFEYDLTPHLKGGKNLLAVFVSMEKIPPTEISLGEAVTVNLTASKILSMSKGMFGPLSPDFPNRAYDLHGIWQPVRLVVTGAARIDDVWFKPSLDGADIDVTLDAPARAKVLLKHRVTDAKTGEALFAEDSNEVVVESNTHIGLGIKGVGPRLKLWTPAEPNLYVLEVTLLAEDGKTVLDTWSAKVGFRTFEAKGNNLLLNGKPYFLRGANQLPYGKNPTEPALARKLIQHLHDNNIRMTRTHCTPWNEAWLGAADEIGVGVSVEGIRPWALVGKIGPTPPDMMQHWLTEQADVIKRIRNHPSVLIHTIGNEMMLRDEDNVDKWKQLSEVTKLTREVDPFRPIVSSSTYVREKKRFDEIIAPNNIDDGDIDDVHNYKAWYSDSPFITDSAYKADLKRRGAVERPFTGQEQSTGYPDLDTGLPVLRYTRDLLTPQAWIGVYAYPGNDPAWFLEYNRIVTKRWAEQLRFQRGPLGEGTSGFSLFSLECWFSHSYDTNRVKPYPVLEAVKQAYAPIGLAIETGRRRFYSGEQVETAIFVTNDDEQYRDQAGLSVRVMFVDPASNDTVASQDFGPTDVAYYATAKVPATLGIPEVQAGRRKLNVVTCALVDGKEVSRTVDPIEIFPRVETPEFPAAMKLEEAMAKAEAGETVIVFAPDMKEMLERFPDDIYDDEAVLREDYKQRVADAKAKKQDEPRKPKSFEYEARKDLAEFADWTPARGTKLVAGLEPMDLRWWGRKDDWKVYVATGSFRLKPGGKARELIRYIPAHSYLAANRVPWQYRTVLFEIPVGKGRLWVCNLDLAACAGVDPVADLLARNLRTAAADPDSTTALKPLPSHEEMLSGKLPE